MENGTFVLNIKRRKDKRGKNMNYRYSTKKNFTREEVREILDEIKSTLINDEMLAREYLYDAPKEDKKFLKGKIIGIEQAQEKVDYYIGLYE